MEEDMKLAVIVLFLTLIVSSVEGSGEVIISSDLSNIVFVVSETLEVRMYNGIAPLSSNSVEDAMSDSTLNFVGFATAFAISRLSRSGVCFVLQKNLSGGIPLESNQGGLFVIFISGKFGQAVPVSFSVRGDSSHIGKFYVSQDQADWEPWPDP